MGTYVYHWIKDDQPLGLKMDAAFLGQNDVKTDDFTWLCSVIQSIQVAHAMCNTC